MRKLFFTFLCVFSIFSLKGYSAVPFTVELEQVQIPGAPSLHSFSFAQSNGKWLFIGGRTNGMHGFSVVVPSFPRAYGNRNIFVVDPVTNQVWQRNIYTDLPIAIADPLKAHNPQHYQNGNMLYITGGMGIDSLRDSTVTFATLTGINVSGIINAIMNNQSIAPFVSQITDSRMQVCGGEMAMIDGSYYLVGGQNFSGEYKNGLDPNSFFQQYTNRYSKFNIVTVGSSIAIQNYVEFNDAVNLHRRDMNVVPVINPDGSEGATLYGGVFRYDKDLPFLNPIYINSSGYNLDESFSQRFSQYTCAYLNMFDSVKKDMHTVFFGGTSLYYTDANSQVKMDTLVPFIKDITAVSKLQNGTSVETILPLRFTEYLGTNAKFILNENTAHYNNGVLKLANYSARTQVGYIFGGIRVPLPNYTVGSASDRIFKVYITYSPVGVTQINSEVPSSFSLMQNYPNPFNPNTNIKFNVSKAGLVNITVYNLMGKEVEQLVNNNLSAGSYEVNWNAASIPSGIYFYKLTSENFSEVKKMMLVK